MRFLLALAVVLSVLGCGGGGESTPAIGGGGAVTAGPLRVEGQVNTPQTEQVGSVTTHALTGNISKATLNDASPTADESEILYATLGSNGSEIAAVNADGSGPIRTVIANMSGTADHLMVDPTGKYVYYLRNSNLQRTDILDGTSNTLLAKVGSYSLSQSGAKICYKKLGTDEVWAANAKGSGQSLVKHISQTVSVVGCQSDTVFAVHDGTSFQTLDITNGQLGRIADFTGFQFFRIAFSPFDRALYLNCSLGTDYYLYRMEIPPLNVAWGPLAIRGGTTQVQPSIFNLGPEQNSAGFDFSDYRMKRYDSNLQIIVTFPYDGLVTSMAWTPFRTTLPLVGPGSSFLSGVGALLCSEVGLRTPAILAADAVTRSSLVVTSLNDGKVGNAVYRIDCDNLKALSYATRNAYLWKHVVTGPSGLKGAIVSFDSSTGTVADIVTFTKRPVVTRQGTSWEVEGELSEVISSNGAGKRAAKATEVLR